LITSKIDMRYHRRVTTPRSGLAIGADGEPLRYRVHGQGPPMLLLHGLVSSEHHWPFFIRHYLPRYSVISWDYRGHGGQPPPADLATIGVEPFAADARAVLEAAFPGQQAVVCGLSFGVQVALELVRAHPDRVRALVLLCGTWGHPLDRVSSSPALRRLAAAALRRFGRGGRAARLIMPLVGTAFVRELAYLSGGAHRTLCPRDLLDGILQHASALDPRVAGAIAAAYFEHSARDVLPRIRVPTCIFAGDKDELTPVARAEEMQRAIPGSTLHVFPGHSHLVQLERPHQVHGLIDRFLADNHL
jgi:pimeloyl-ACP methyl ester carboxylesterase